MLAVHLTVDEGLKLKIAMKGGLGKKRVKVGQGEKSKILTFTFFTYFHG